jgi:N-acylglucosamine 2-epimerase
MDSKTTQKDSIVQTIDLDLHSTAFQNSLLNDTVPFWLKYGMDSEFGGIITSIDREGNRVDTDKSVWVQGRFAWLMATLYNTVEQRQEWLDAALSCLQFLEDHAFDENGKMYFQLTRDGQPVRMRRYFYSEAFASMAYAACARATRNPDYAKKAEHLFQNFTRGNFTPGNMAPKFVDGTRPTKAMGPWMIGLNVAQTLRENIEYKSAELWIDRCIQTIEMEFCKPELGALMECVGEDGGVLDHFDGRILNPGHAFEAAWFILYEARVRGEAKWVELGTQIADWMWERGWDQEHGGVYYFRDVYHKPISEYWHDMKFWWPHNEAILANLLAYTLSGEQRFADRYLQVHEWAHDHFADPAHGEWFGYLHRDGSRSTDLKGNLWKGPFHLPRMQYYCWQFLKDATKKA